MIKNLSIFSTQFLSQVFIFLCINGLFIFKYFPRVGVSSPILFAIYTIGLIILILLYQAYSTRFSKKTFKIAYWVLFVLISLVIIVLLLKIDRYAVRVDRWSAVTFFIDNLLQGKYPYSAHTHVSNTNFPSPFPIWYLLNSPFYFMGDVGIGLIFFLLLTVITIQYTFADYKKSFFFLLLLFLSPAYWWEVAVRSDGLSNALLIFSFILWFNKRSYSLSNNLLLAIISCGLIASTRLSAILPVAILLFKPYTELSWKSKILFPLGILAVALISFLPFIFWDTHNWIFFSRNPFMSQTSVGNPFLLILMVILGCIVSFKWKTLTQFFAVVSFFMFAFILGSQLVMMFSKGVNGTFFEDGRYDISYFTLLLPYCLAFITNSLLSENKSINYVP